MKTLRVLSIIGIIWMVLCFIFLVTFQQEAYAYPSKDSIDTIAGWGFFGLLYLLALSIVALVQTNRQLKHTNQKEVSRNMPFSSSATEKLIELNDLKQKGILSEDEFQAMKLDILKL